eukprot:NODE_3068_length_835_cov_56.073077.p1 GENE.NODE_3068_length_835_cov_56.073077~~NODE_3068_length_835_cov_56.073077.p1  ORF type:complete len:218 (+),score=64.55 NODE_3068_length_835_cov_56.073077:68-655(+)
MLAIGCNSSNPAIVACRVMMVERAAKEVKAFAVATRNKELEAERSRDETNPDKARQAAELINKQVKVAVGEGVANSHADIVSARRIVLELVTESTNRLAQKVLLNAERLKHELELQVQEAGEAGEDAIAIGAYDAAAKTIEADLKRAEKRGTRAHMPAIKQAVAVVAELREREVERAQERAMMVRRCARAAGPPA